MADGTITVTIDTGEWVYIDSSGIQHTVTNGQTFTLASVDTGDGGIYTPNIAQSVTTTDGYTIELLPDTNSITGSLTPAGDTAVVNAPRGLGEIAMRCTSDGVVERWKCVSLDVDDADSCDEFTNAVFEKVNNPMHTFTWTSVSGSFA